jgi:hypothetical protein
VRDRSELGEAFPVVRPRLWWLRPPTEAEVLTFRLRRQLPSGQARVAIALIADDPSPTSYTQVAENLGLHLGTVHRHLGRIRSIHPALYAELMTLRRRHLAERHVRVDARRRRRSLLWGRQRYAAKYRAEHGVWPWERFDR